MNQFCNRRCAFLSTTHMFSSFSKRKCQCNAIAVERIKIKYNNIHIQTLFSKNASENSEMNTELAEELKGTRGGGGEGGGSAMSVGNWKASFFSIVIIILSVTKCRINGEKFGIAHTHTHSKWSYSNSHKSLCFNCCERGLCCRLPLPRLMLPFLHHIYLIFIEITIDGELISSF